MSGKRVLIALVPVTAALGSVMLLLSVNASVALFGLYLSIAAWLFVLSLIVLPWLAFKRWTASAEPVAEGLAQMRMHRA